MPRFVHPFADLIGLRFEEQTKGTSVCALTVTENLFNPQNVVHGAVLCSLADTGMGGALYPLLLQGQLCATVEIKIAYFKPVRDGRVVCRSKVVHHGKRVASLESEVFNRAVLVAKATGTYAVFEPGAGRA